MSPKVIDLINLLILSNETRSFNPFTNFFLFSPPHSTPQSLEPSILLCGSMGFPILFAYFYHMLAHLDRAELSTSTWSTLRGFGGALEHPFFNLVRRLPLKSSQ